MLCCEAENGSLEPILIDDAGFSKVVFGDFRLEGTSIS